MKKTVTLLILLCLATVALAQYEYRYPYPIPTLVEQSVPGFVVEQMEPDPLKPVVAYPVAYVPMVNKQSCFRECLDLYTDCQRAGGDWHVCRMEVYFPCIDACPNGFYPQPAFSYPADTRAVCLSDCNEAYARCTSMGGSIDACSAGVLNPCQTKCDAEYPLIKPTREMPAGLSCDEMCKWKVQDCVMTGSSGCDIALLDCKSSCPAPVVETPKPVVQQPMMYQPAPIPVVRPVEPSFWERFKKFLFG